MLQALVSSRVCCGRNDQYFYSFIPFLERRVPIWYSYLINSRYLSVRDMGAKNSDGCVVKMEQTL